MAIVQQRLPARQNRMVHDPRAGKAVGSSLDDLQLFDHGGADAFELREPGRRGGEDAVEIAKMLHQPQGEGFDILPGNGAEQNQLQKFVIRHGGGSAFHEPRPKPLAMIAHIGERAQRGRGLLIAEKRERVFRHLRYAFHAHMLCLPG